MRRFPWLLSLGASPFIASLLFASACRSPQQESQQPEYTPTATVKDIMDSIVDPSADVLWESVATVVNASGTDERAPRTDEEWTNVRRGAIRLVEATNLLLMPGRHVARPGEKSETPGIELEPEQIEGLVNKDRETWYRLVKGLHDTSLETLHAIDAKDAKALFDFGERLDEACENCHSTYWYPKQQPSPGLKPGAQ